MNYSIIRKILGVVIQFTGAFLALPAVCGLFYGEKQAIVYIVLSIAYFVIGRIISGFKLSSNAYYAREGLVIVGMSWIVISILGAIPRPCDRRHELDRHQYSGRDPSGDHEGHPELYGRAV